MSYSDRHLWNSSEVDLNGATDLEVATFAPLNRVVIHKIGVLVTSTAAGGAVVTFEDRVDATTDTTIEAVTIPAADSDGNLYFTEIVAGYVLLPSHKLNFAVSESGTGPTAILMIEYSILDVDLDATDSDVIESA